MHRSEGFTARTRRTRLDHRPPRNESKSRRSSHQYLSVREAIGQSFRALSRQQPSRMEKSWWDRAGNFRVTDSSLKGSASAHGSVHNALGTEWQCEVPPVEKRVCASGTRVLYHRWDDDHGSVAAFHASNWDLGIRRSDTWCW